MLTSKWLKMSEREDILRKKNDLCIDFAQNWATTFNDTFPWDKLNSDDAYFALVVAITNLVYSYFGSDVEDMKLKLDLIPEAAITLMRAYGPEEKD